MSSKSSSSKKQQAREKAKLAAIPVLVLVLVYVVYSQMNGSDEPVAPVAVKRSSAPAPSRRTPDATLATNSPGGAIDELEETFPEREWESTPLAEIIEYDPFVKTGNLKSIEEKLADQEELVPEPDLVSPDDQERVDTALRSVKAKILIKSSKGSAAWIGSRMVREGDLWQEGMRIESIDLDGVTVAPDRDEEEDSEPPSVPESLNSTLKNFFPGLMNRKSP